MNKGCFKVGDRYSAEYVNKLYSMVKRNTTFNFNFICFTDDAEGIKRHQESHIDVRPLPHEFLAHWWNRMALFKKGVLSGPCINIDLDVVIHDNIDELFELDDEFYMVPSGIFGNDCYNDCVVKFNADKHNFMWDEFSENRQLLIPLHGVDFAMTSILKLCKYEHKLCPEEWFWRFRTKEHSHKSATGDKDFNQANNKFCHVIKLNDTLKQHEVRDDEFVKKYWR